MTSGTRVPLTDCGERSGPPALLEPIGEPGLGLRQSIEELRRLRDQPRHGQRTEQPGHREHRQKHETDGIGTADPLALEPRDGGRDGARDHQPDHEDQHDRKELDQKPRGRRRDADDEHRSRRQIDADTALSGAPGRSRHGGRHRSRTNRPLNASCMPPTVTPATTPLVHTPKPATRVDRAPHAHPTEGPRVARPLLAMGGLMCSG